jgi:hypothetical protein
MWCNVLSRHTGIWCAFAFGFLGIFTTLYPVTHTGAFNMHAGFSWVPVLGEAHRLGLIFGRDIAFTGGPLSALYTGYFDADLAWWVAGFQIGTCALAATLCLSIARHTDVVGIAVILIAILFMVPDTLIILPPFLLVWRKATSPDPSSADQFITVYGAVITAALTLAKFTVAPLALLCFVFADVLDLSVRRLPLALVSYAIALVLLFSILEGGPAWFIPYVRQSLDISVGYTEAMSLSGAWSEVVVFVAALLSVGISVAVTERSLWLKQSTTSLRVAVLTLSFAAYLFISFKEGFVRHYTHSAVAWANLAFGVAIYGNARATVCLSRRHLIALQLLAIAIVLVVEPAIQARRFGQPISTHVNSALTRSPLQLSGLMDLISSPCQWLETMKTWKELQQKPLRDRISIAALEGSVDTIPLLGAALIAKGFDYKPRPTVEFYVTYTKSLIELNRSYFVGDRAPKYLLFRPDMIDDRHPAFAEGPLWPEFLRLYHPDRMIGDVALLRRRDNISSETGLAPVSQGTAEMGQPIRLPPGPLFLKADMHLNVLGNAMGLLFKPPTVRMRVRYEDGSDELYLVIPQIVREGFLVSPLVATAQDYAMFARGENNSGLKTAVALTFEIGWLGTFAYDRNIGIVIESIRR